MEKTSKGTNGTSSVNPEERWIRLQEIGLAQFFAIPVALMIGVMCGFGFRTLVLVALALATSGYCFFMRGYEKRKEIAQNTHNEQ